MTRARPPRTWNEADLAELATRALAAGREAGIDAIGIGHVAPFTEARRALDERKAAGLHDTMSFTFKNPARSTEPAHALPGAQALVVGASRYRRADQPTVDQSTADESTADESVDDEGDAPFGRVARYAWADHYGPLRTALGAVGAVLRAEGFRTRVMADDNALVDRAAAHRAGIGWLGKSGNLLVPGLGSWVVLGSLVTDAPLPATAVPVDDGCGSCVRCLEGCPTGAIVSPGVVDARRCLAWLVQRPGPFPVEFRSALGDRLYGCDDCQEVCPPNRTADRHLPPPSRRRSDEPAVALTRLLTSSDAELLARHGRFYLPGRDVGILRRNALVALGNAVTTAADPAGLAHRADVDAALRLALVHADPVVRGAAVWAAGRLGRTDLVHGPGGAGDDPDPIVRAEVAALP